MASIGARIRGIRAEKSIALDQLAATTGVRLELLEAIEREEAGPEKLSGRDVLKLARALGASIDWLLYGRVPEVYTGPTVIVCTRGQGRHSHRCKECGSRASKQCDYALTAAGAAKLGRQSCDAWLCDRCAHVVGPDRDYCGAHYRVSRSEATARERAKET